MSDCIVEILRNSRRSAANELSDKILQPTKFGMYSSWFRRRSKFSKKRRLGKRWETFLHRSVKLTKRGRERKD
jgi:hypothetical protein